MRAGQTYHCPMPARRNDNHPPKGSTVKVEPIRVIDAIQRLKARLEGQGRCIGGAASLRPTTCDC